ncbi:hypothetical protein NS228_04040 [Methylobacterium indicum]|nr:hypothetical protein NS229_26035 [Methylobacterium indicum]KTS41981.1 hypothetical protein NS228_04040 [Methylobacterium indicum]KTS47867.1 hypothetical protein NS230_20075 [Methylobacterium indicum]
MRDLKLFWNLELFRSLAMFRDFVVVDATVRVRDLATPRGRAARCGSAAGPGVWGTDDASAGFAGGSLHGREPGWT